MLVPLQDELLVTKVCQLIVIITHQKVRVGVHVCYWRHLCDIQLFSFLKQNLSGVLDPFSTAHTSSLPVDSKQKVNCATFDTY